MYKKILVAVDGSDVSNAALDYAIKLASTVYATLRLVHVLEGPSHLPGDDRRRSLAQTYVDALRQESDRVLFEASVRARRAGVEVECMLAESDTERAGHAIVTQAKLCNADLIVVGTHGRRGLHRVLMGSDAEYVVRHAKPHVMVIRNGALTPSA
ncbi:universal stress protein [Caenimonas koreensis DSM 17982]|uniref:Universal stress protein n=1 Tax=Caenimonas koreensis DSM 17982 TaxID=1121255 RepID=A0A844B3W0_9BURK|nr:universal stress protein [Caenimonas koreensis]MRD47912.1 universal stress protein [Caenimonas koreensis DSM 17982]